MKLYFVIFSSSVPQSGSPPVCQLLRGVTVIFICCKNLTMQSSFAQPFLLTKIYIFFIGTSFTLSKPRLLILKNCAKLQEFSFVC